MRKFLGKRGFAVFTSLALCASLVAPSFAATFADLQNVINSDKDVTEGEILREGNTITLNGTVTRDDTDVDRGKDPITIGSGKDIILNLNGNTIDSTNNSSKAVIWVKGGGSLTIEDSGENGTIQGGNHNGAVRVDDGQLTLNGGTISGNENGTGVKVNSGASFTMNGGTISGNTNSGVRVDGGAFEMTGGAITGNSIKEGGAGGGGVYVTSGSFTMNDGVITGNKAEMGSGGGVGVKGENSSFTMNGGEISNNTVGNNGGQGGGGGVWVKDKATFEMNNGKITENKVEKDGGNGGGVAIHQANFTMNGGEISGNESDRGIGVLVNAGSDNGGDASFTMTGGYVKGDNDRSCIYLEESSGKDAKFELSGDAVMDGSIRLGQGTQVITSDVKQPSGEHDYTSFDATDENGENQIKIVPSQTDKSSTGGSGYQATEDTLLKIHYEHVWGSDWADNGDGTHGHRCEHCRETNPASAEGHKWDDGVVTTEPTTTETGVKTFTCEDCKATYTEPIGRLPDTGNGGGDTIIDDPDVPLGGLPDEVEIEEPDVPLAGLFTRADAIGYLWEQAGSPDAALSDFPDVSADHEWAVAIGWAQDVGIALPDLEGNFRPDDLLLRSVADIELNPEGEFEQFLNRYAEFAGIELEPGELFIALDGEPDDIIMGEDAQVIFDSFFVKLELALAQAA